MVVVPSSSTRFYRDGKFLVINSTYQFDKDSGVARFYPLLTLISRVKYQISSISSINKSHDTLVTWYWSTQDCPRVTLHTVPFQQINFHRNVRFQMFPLNDFDQDFRLKMGRKWRYFDITIKITDNLNFFLFVSRSAGQIW